MDEHSRSKANPAEGEPAAEQSPPTEVAGEFEVAGELETESEAAGDSEPIGESESREDLETTEGSKPDAEPGREAEVAAEEADWDTALGSAADVELADTEIFHHGAPGEDPAAGSESLPITPIANDPVEGPTAAEGGPGTTVIRRRRQGVTTSVAMATAFLLLGCLVVILAWWQGSPESPSALLASDQENAAASDVDLEQAAFLERRKRDLGIERLPPGSEMGASLTNRKVVAILEGAWVFDLGQEPVVAVLGSELVRREDRGRLRLELYQVWSRDLPDYFTVLQLPEGLFLTFQGSSGEYRHVLEGLELHGRDLLSYSIAGVPNRRYAHRLSDADGEEVSDRGRSGRGPSMGRDDRIGAGSGPQLRNEEDRGREDGEILIQREPGPPIDVLWQQAEQLRRHEHYQSLSRLLDRILRRDPDHRKAKRWRRQIGGWSEKQEKAIVRQLSRQLGELASALEDRDTAAAAMLWGPADRAATRSALGRRTTAYSSLRVWARLRQVEMRDGLAEFEAVVTIEGRAGQRRQTTIEEVPWRARYERGAFLGPFPAG